MFDWPHYVPILKYKRAELSALEHLQDNDKALISPLFQFVMPPPPRLKKGEKQKPLSEQLNISIKKFELIIPTISETIEKSWGATPFFIDVSLIDSSIRNRALSDILVNCEKRDLEAVPVLYLSADEELQKTAITKGKSAKGLCLRILRNDLSDPKSLEQQLNLFVAKSSLKREEIDILVDYQIADPECTDFQIICKNIPNLEEWRTFIFASGAFPRDLSEFSVDKHIIERSDWNCWESQIEKHSLTRRPSFSDYTIQHPVYSQELMQFSPSASIKYTLNNKWMIMRGQQNKPKQYLAYSQLLSKDKDFFGGSFSYGDMYIEEKGKDILSKKTGNATTWLIAGINHHLACTTAQLTILL